MWLDGIITDQKRGRRRKKPNRRRHDDFFTVSARVKEKSEDRRRRTAVVVLLLIVVIGFGWILHLSLAAAGRYFFTENDRYSIRNWELHSNGRLLTPAHIREYSQLGDDENLFAVDLREVRRRLEAVAVVESVEVARKLPDTLMIRVNERLAIARLGVDPRSALAVDRHGHVLGPSSLRPNLPAIVGLRQLGVRPGIAVTDPLFIDALRLLELCERPHVNPYVRIKSINVSDPDDLELRLDHDERVRVARVHMEARLAELLGIMRESRNRGQVARAINMTGELHIPPVVTY